jgi:hypothetical protein
MVVVVWSTRKGSNGGAGYGMGKDDQVGDIVGCFEVECEGQFVGPGESLGAIPNRGEDVV